MARTSDCRSEGCEFESRRLRHLNPVCAAIGGSTPLSWDGGNYMLV